LIFLLRLPASRTYQTLRERGRAGQGMVEYAIILILVSVVCIVRS